MLDFRFVFAKGSFPFVLFFSLVFIDLFAYNWTPFLNFNCIVFRDMSFFVRKNKYWFFLQWVYLGSNSTVATQHKNNTAQLG